MPSLRLWTYAQGPFLLVWILLSFTISVDSLTRIDSEARNNILYDTFMYYNPILLVAFTIFLWGVNLWVFSRTKIHYPTIFALREQRLTYMDIWTIAALIGFLLITSMTLYLSLSSLGSSFAASQPILLYFILPVMMIQPTNIFYRSSRFYFLEILALVFLPLKKVKFSDFFLADLLTSLSKVLSDIERATCRMYTGQLDPSTWFDSETECGSHSIWIPRILALPYFCRFFQCLRQYAESEPKDKVFIFNALKYALSLPVILLSSMKYYVSTDMWDGVYRPLWLICGLISTMYSFIWDVERDWNLRLLSCISYTRERPLGRQLIFEHHWIYYAVIVTDFVLRWAWMYKLSAHLRDNYITIFLMTALEILRRFQWIFFRLENEWTKRPILR